MSRDLQRWEMRNPVEVLISRETAAARRSCAGCAHTKVVESPFGDSVTRCLKGRPYGRKCKRFEVINV
ncbi:hypothetical protein ACWV16_26425 [Achromobacter xylosoxidans]|uniref:hypothetical protein n=1 Tax=Alcaligenes xylosoxydans xylosoxydans TaxID=85698 RepID=UPI0011DDB726|nr:hypothetical protein [Achromobacter xylosoxidans]